jgi:hypothetical protein
MPNGMSSTAHATKTFPRQSRLPDMAAARHSARLGRGRPRRRSQAYRISPAMMKRDAASPNGGNSCTATRLAR